MIKLKWPITYLLLAIIPLFFLGQFISKDVWLYDDLGILKGIVEHGIWAHFYHAGVWQNLSPSNLTPWVMASYGFDWYISGLDSTFYYQHQLISFAVVLLLAFAIFKRFFPTWVSAVSLLLFVISLPTANVLQLLMTRHYLEGLGFSLIAIWAYLQSWSSPQQALKYTMLGVLAYILAATAKEIYLPLVFLLALLPPYFQVKQWQDYAWRLAPYAIVATLYTLWRSYMLPSGQLIRGYGEIVPELDWSALAENTVNLLAWQAVWQWGIALVVFLGLFGLLCQQRRWAACRLSIGVALLVFLPLLPVLSILSSRYLFLPYFIFCVAIAAFLSLLQQRQHIYLAILVSISLFASQGYSLQKGQGVFQQQAALEQIRTEIAFLLNNKQPGWLINPAATYNALPSLRVSSAGVQACYDPCGCSIQANDSLYQYTQGKIKPLVMDLDHCQQRPLEKMQFHFDGTYLHWVFADTEVSQYGISIDQPSFFHPVQAVGKYPLNQNILKNLERIILKYKTHTGKVFYTPPVFIPHKLKHWSYPEK